MESYKENSLSGQVFYKLRERILNGQYKENDELREIAIGAELGVSRTPVREALRQLELEGLIKIIPNKGAYVTGITAKDVKDIYEIRFLLEGLCARWAAEHIHEEQLNKLRETVLLAEYHLNLPSSEQVYHLDGAFHRIMFEASGSKRLEHVLADFHRYVQRSRRHSIASKERAEKSIQEHKEILEAIEAKDPDRAEQLARAHIAHVMQHLHTQGYENL